MGKPLAHPSAVRSVLETDGVVPLCRCAVGCGRYIEEKKSSPENARSVFETGVRYVPDHAPLFRVYGDFERRQGNYDRARELYEEAITCDPNYEQAYVVSSSPGAALLGYCGQAV